MTILEYLKKYCIGNRRGRYAPKEKPEVHTHRYRKTKKELGHDVQQS